MTKPLIAVIDYDIGNSESMVNALVAQGAEPLLTRDPARIAGADALVLPGVGAFSQGMANLRKYALLDAINDFIARDKPFLGVCLGMQLLMEQSEEFGSTAGLGIFRGSVKKLPLAPGDPEKLPHIGWNAIQEPAAGRWANSILSGTAQGSDLYFVHSFAAIPDDPTQVLSVTRHGSHSFCSSMRQGKSYGCQFHPEKSGPAGLAVLKNFILTS